MFTLFCFAFRLYLREAYNIFYDLLHRLAFLQGRRGMHLRDWNDGTCVAAFVPVKHHFTVRKTYVVRMGILTFVT